MSTPEDTRDRVIALEVKVQNLKDDVQKISMKVDEVQAKQDQMITLLTEANGMRKMLRWLYVTAVVIGGFIFAYWSSFKALLLKIGG